MLFRNVVSDLVNFFLPDLHHQLVILGIIAHITCDVFFLQSTDAVLEPRCSRNGPWPNEVLIALIGLEFCFSMAQFSFKTNMYWRQLFADGKFPGLGTVRDVAIT